MGHTTTRISNSAHGVLRQLAKAEGRPMLALLDEAVEALRRQRFLEQLNTAYAALRADPRQWAEIEADRRPWDATLSDGLAVAEGRPRYATHRRPKRGKGR